MKYQVYERLLVYNSIRTREFKMCRSEDASMLAIRESATLAAMQGAKRYHCSITHMDQHGQQQTVEYQMSISEAISCAENLACNRPFTITCLALGTIIVSDGTTVVRCNDLKSFAGILAA